MFAKKLLLCAALAGLVCSCSTFRTSTATSMEVNTSLVSRTVADLEVSPERITYVYIPKKADRKAGLKHIIENATAAALKSSGGADVLVERQYEVLTKRRWLRRDKVRSVTITGYPGKYKNFRVTNRK